ncbi:MAG: hypothetical protein KatS3mg087_1648 [Patescibacteria group bacterium]|nr:MAG: hypothetical protein KatS3mg087_1648 [Patescibacteria group bacterium]
MIIKFDGLPPPKKNQRILLRRGGRLLSIPSKNFTAWRKDVLAKLKHLSPVMQTPPVAISITYTFGDKRKRDLTNLTDSVMDVLVDGKIIEDDNWCCVPRLVIDAQYSKGVYQTIIQIEPY